MSCIFASAATSCCLNVLLCCVVLMLEGMFTRWTSTARNLLCALVWDVRAFFPSRCRSSVMMFNLQGTGCAVIKVLLPVQTQRQCLHSMRLLKI